MIRWLLFSAVFIWLALLFFPHAKLNQAMFEDFKSGPIKQPVLVPLPPLPLYVESIKPLSSVELKQKSIQKPRSFNSLIKPSPTNFQANQAPMPANQLLADGPPSGAEALGGVLSLDSLNEPTMPPAALVERARWQASANPLLPLPSEWRSFFRKALGSATAELAPAMQWHQPVAGLCTTELVPVLLRSNAKPITLRQPKNSLALAAHGQWLQEAPQPPPGQQQALLLHLDPITQGPKCK